MALDPNQLVALRDAIITVLAGGTLGAVNFSIDGESFDFARSRQELWAEIENLNRLIVLADGGGFEVTVQGIP